MAYIRSIRQTKISRNGVFTPQLPPVEHKQLLESVQPVAHYLFGSERQVVVGRPPAQSVRDKERRRFRAWNRLYCRVGIQHDTAIVTRRGPLYSRRETKTNDQ